ncbi:MFS transporter [Catenulispora yoronensis]
MTAAAPLTRRDLVTYAVGSIGTGIYSTVPGLLLLYFMTDTLGVAAGVAGLVVTLPKAWDVFFNPLVGAASDRDAVRTGRRTRLLIAGTVALPPAFALMFLAPPPVAAPCCGSSSPSCWPPARSRCSRSPTSPCPPRCPTGRRSARGSWSGASSA